MINKNFGNLSNHDLSSVKKLYILGEFYRLLQCVVNQKSIQSSVFYNQLFQTEQKPSNDSEGIFITLMITEIRNILDEYEFKIREKERHFLEGEPVNLNFLVATFGKESHLFYNLLIFLNRVFSSDDLKGGALLDELFRRTINGNEFCRVKYQRIFHKAYSGFYKMCTKWLLFGKIEDPYEEFFIKDTRNHLPFLSGMEVRYKKSEKVNLNILRSTSTDSKIFYFKNEAQSTSNWDNDFVLQLSLLPKCLVKVKTAKNILFIGKCLKVIQNKEGLLGPTSQQMTEIIKKITEYDSIEFVRTIQSLKRIVSGNFMQLLLESEVLKVNLNILKDFFLLFKEEFFTIFTEEMGDIMNKAPDKYSEDQINKKLLPNCLIRLGILSDDPSYGKLSFLLKAKGFSYKNFKNIKNLRLCGNVEQKFSSLRLKSAENYHANSVREISHSSLWNLVLQNVQQAFDNVLSFRFKSNPKFHRHDASQNKRFCFRLCLQSAYDVRSSKKALNLTSIKKLETALFIEFGFIQYMEFDQELQTNTQRVQSFIEISVCSPQYKSEHVLSRQILKNEEMNFADQDIVYVRIQSAHKKFKIFVSNENFLQSKRSDFVGSVMEVPLELESHFLLNK
jgi:hypothetical protein